MKPQKEPKRVLHGASKCQMDLKETKKGTPKKTPKRTPQGDPKPHKIPPGPCQAEEDCP